MNMEISSSGSRSSSLWSVLAIILAAAGLAVGGMGLSAANKANKALESVQLESKQAAVDAGQKAESDLRSFSQQVSRAFQTLDQRVATLTQATDQIQSRLSPPKPAVEDKKSTGAGATAEATSGPGRVHEIAKGDLLGTIAKKYGVKVADIQKANPNLNPNNLKVGQKIKIP